MADEITKFIDDSRFIDDSAGREPLLDTQRRTREGITTESRRAVNRPMLDTGRFSASEVSPPGNFAETFRRGAQSGMRTLQADMDYMGAIFNTLSGDEDAALENLELGRLAREQGGQLLEGTISFEDFVAAPTFSGLLDLATSGVGMVTPMATVTAASAGVGGLTAVLGRGLMNTSGKAAAKQLLKEIAEKQRKGITLTPDELAVAAGTAKSVASAAKAGSITGAFIPSYISGSGQSFGEFDEAGVELDSDRARQALTIGAPIALIDTATEVAMVGSFLKLATKKARKDGQGVFAAFAANLGKEVAKNSAKEGAAELAQEEILIQQRRSVDDNYSSQEANLRRGEAAFLGAVAGGAFGTAGGVVGGIPAVARSTKETADKVVAQARQMLDQTSQSVADSQAVEESTQAELFDTRNLGTAPAQPEQPTVDLDAPEQGVQGELFPVAQDVEVAQARERNADLLADEAAFLNEVMGRPSPTQQGLSIQDMTDEQAVALEESFDQQQLDASVREPSISPPATAEPAPTQQGLSIQNMTDEQAAALEESFDQQQLDAAVREPAPTTTQVNDENIQTPAEADSQPVTQADLAAMAQEEQRATEGQVDVRDFNRSRRETPAKIRRGAYKKSTGKPDVFVGAFYRRGDDTIFIDEEYLRSQFDKKPWESPKVEGVNPLPDEFVNEYINNSDDWVRFVELHEKAHTEYAQLEGESTATYENRMNDIAMAEMRDPRLFGTSAPSAAPEAEAAPAEAETTTLVEEDNKTDDSLAAQVDTFNPPEQPTLVNRRSEPDVEELPKRDNPISGGEKERDITSDTATAKNFQDIGYADRRPPIDEPLMLSTVVETYRTAIPNIAVTKPAVIRIPDGRFGKIVYTPLREISTSYRGAHHNGGVIVTDFEVSKHQDKLAGRDPISYSAAELDTYSLPRIIAHELGHAAHSLLGDTLNNNPAVAAELKAIENFLYPGLRQEVLNAQNAGMEADYKFFNYLLSAEELIAEFNVYRLNGTGAEVAPTISSLLESVSNDPNLVIKREVFPSGWLIMDPRTVRADRYLTVEDLTSVLPTQAARAAREAAPRAATPLAAQRPAPADPTPVQRTPATQTAEPELNTADQAFVDSAERNIATSERSGVVDDVSQLDPTEAADQVTDAELAAEIEATPAVRLVQNGIVPLGKDGEGYAPLLDTSKRKTVIQASEENPLYITEREFVPNEDTDTNERATEVEKVNRIVTPVNAAAYYTLRIANHYAPEGPAIVQNFLQFSKYMNDQALKALNDLIFDSTESALYNFYPDFKIDGNINAEFQPGDENIADNIIANNPGAVKVVIRAVPKDRAIVDEGYRVDKEGANRSEKVFDSTMASIERSNQTDKFIKESPFEISGGKIGSKGGKPVIKFQFMTLINGGIRLNAIEDRALIGDNYYKGDPRLAKAGLVRGMQEAVMRGYSFFYTDSNGRRQPLDITEVLAGTRRLPEDVLSRFVFFNGNQGMSLREVVGMRDPFPIADTRTEQSIEAINAKTDEQIAGDVAARYFVEIANMSRDELYYRLSEDLEGTVGGLRIREEYAELKDLAQQEGFRDELDNERQTQLEEAKDRELTRDRFGVEDVSDPELTEQLPGMVLNRAQQAGVFEGETQDATYTTFFELRMRGGSTLVEGVNPLETEKAADTVIEIPVTGMPQSSIDAMEKALNGIKWWNRNSVEQRKRTLANSKLSLAATELGLKVSDPVATKGRPKVQVKLRTRKTAREDLVSPRTRLVVEEGDRMGRVADPSVTATAWHKQLADPLKKKRKQAPEPKRFGNFDQATQQVITQAEKILGISTPMNFITLTELQNNFDAYTGPGSRFAWARESLSKRVEKMQKNPENAAGVEFLAGQSAIVVVNEKLFGRKYAQSDVGAALAIGHEIGHVFFSEEISKIEANPQLRKRMFNSFKKARAAEGAPVQYMDEGIGFEEWFSDQVSKYVYDSTIKATDGTQSKFKQIAGRLKRFFAAVNRALGGRFKQDRFFKTYMDDVVATNKKRNVQRKDTTGQYLSASQRIESRDLINAIDNDWIKKATRAGNKAYASKTTGFYKKYISTANARLQFMGPAGQAIAAFFQADAGKVGLRGMLQEAPAKEAYFTNKMVDILGIDTGSGENSWTSERIEKIMLEVEDETIPTEQLSTREAKELRALYKEAFEYNKDPDGNQYVQIRERKNFGGGRALSESAIEQRIDEFINFLMNDPETGRPRKDFNGNIFMDEKEAELTARYILAQPGESLEIAVQRIKQSDYSKAAKQGKLEALYKAFDEAKITPGSANQFVRKLGVIPTKQLREAGFLEPAGLAQIKYFHHLTRGVEYEKRGGSTFLKTAIANLPQEYKAEASSIIEGYLAKKGQTMKPWLRTFNSATMVHTTLTTLLLAPISSITDLSGVAMRGKEMKNMDLFFKNMMNATKGTEAYETARRIGTIMQEGTDTVYITQGDQDFANKWARDIMHKFFKYTGLNLWTRYSRVVAVGMGRDFFIRNAEELSDPNITPERRETLLRWMAEGHPELTAEDVLGWADGSNFGTEAQLRVDHAIRKFADESVVRPNQAQRPSWANDPRFQILFQLKSFFYAFGDTVIAGAIREGANRYATDGKFSGAGQMALLAGVTLIPLTMLGLEIRELVKYLLQAATPGIEATDYTFRSDYMDTTEYMYEIFSRTGVPGKWTLALTSIESLKWEGPLGPIITNVPIFDAFDESVFDGRPFTRNAPVINNIQ